MAGEGLTFPSRFGTDSVEFDIFLKKWSGELLTAFEEKVVLKNLIRKRNITSGKSAQFPLTGVATAAYLVPGESILTEAGPKYLSRPKVKEKVIQLDHLLVSSVMLHDIDAAMTHYDVRSEFVDQLALALANKYDLSICQVIANGSLQAATGAGGSWDNAGIKIVKANWLTSVTEIKDAMFEAAEKLDENEVPDEDRHFILSPNAWYKLSKDSEVASADFNKNTGGDMGLGRVLKLAGFHIHKSNRLAKLRALGAAVADAGQRGTEYSGTFTNVQALFFQRAHSVGTVTLLDTRTEHSRENAYQGDLMTASLSVGTGVLHPEACGQINTV